MSQTSSFELHVAQTATRSPKLFLYTHYQDQGHAPFLTVTPPSDNDPCIVLECRDTFKFKPNLQDAAKNRIDLYAARSAALPLSQALEQAAEGKAAAQEAQVHPELSQSGPKALPLIPTKTYQVPLVNAGMWIAGASVFSAKCQLYAEMERPDPNHGVMLEEELHLGIALGPDTKLNDTVNEQKVTHVQVPDEELKVRKEKNPVPKGQGLIRIRLTPTQAGRLAHAIELLCAST